jgi:hypothetical protein
VTAIDIARLPRRSLRAGTQLSRIHRSRLGPWFFDDSQEGRFNPTGTRGRGTCYWVERPLGAWIESFRTVMTLTEEDVAARALSTITLTDDLMTRDLTVSRALSAGVTVAVTGGGDYAPAQALADRLQGISEAVRYRVSHDPGAKHIAVAWFGGAGPASGDVLAALPAASTADIPEEVIEDAGRRFGYVVLPTPV